MSTDPDYSIKQRIHTQNPQMRSLHLKCLDVIIQDQHYSDLIGLAAKFRYNRLDRFIQLILNEMMNRNLKNQQKIERTVKKNKQEERILQPIKNYMRRSSYIEYPKLPKKTTDQLKIQQEKNRKLLKLINENEMPTSIID